MAMTDDEVERMYVAKQYYDEEKLEKFLQKDENDEARSYRPEP